jgi:riboflavin biosynthesis pyrimidine reductase
VTRIDAIIILVLAGAVLLLAGDPPAGLKKNSRIFIEKMQNDLDGYIAAEMMQKKVRLEIVQEADQADYLMVGSGTAEQDRTTGNVRIFERATKRLVFAGEAGDRSLWWGAMSRGGQRKVASRLVDKLKDQVR